jgi:predicted amidohydrolase
VNKLRVALVQAELRWQDPAANRTHLESLMDRRDGADVFVLPETFTTGFLGDQGCAIEPFEGPTVAWMRRQAQDRGAAVTGSVALGDQSGQRRNRMVFVRPDGDLAWYDKRHLFSFGGEDKRYAAGSTHTMVEWLGWTIDLQVCYDLRFPVWCRNDRGFDLQLFVANWPSPRAEAWRLLLRARAVENQAFVVGVNRTGQDGKGKDYPGRSVVIDPAGERLVELDDTESVETVTLDRQALQDFRRDFPFLQDRDRFTLDR